MNLEKMIAEVWQNRELLKDETYTDAIRNVIDKLDTGELRTAMPVSIQSYDQNSETSWQVNEWVKQAIILYFGIQKMETYTLPPFEFYDKMKLKKNYSDMGVRAVPHAIARYGSFLGRNVVLMPSYVNIGAFV